LGSSCFVWIRSGLFVATMAVWMGRCFSGTLVAMSSGILRQDAFLGADRVVYLDAAATSLMPKVVFDAQRDYFQLSCANPHSETHLGSRSTTLAIEDARESIASLFGADRSCATIFVGAGSTAALNRAARVVSSLAAERPRVIVSALEHHSNLLPWWDRSGLEVVLVSPLADGSHDYAAIEYALQQAPTAAVAASAASNVTGAVADLPLLGAIARRYGAMTVIDAAQAAPHLAIDVSSSGIDFLAISGHKLFVPGSPGVLIARRSLMERSLFGDVGGGTVDRVYPDGRVDYSSCVEAREEAGTPNVPGVLGLGIIAKVLLREGMSALRAHDIELTSRLLAGLRAREWIVVYGSDAPGGIPRVGTVAFNLKDVPHGLVGAALSDLFKVWVRTHCFCAHPYVQLLLERSEPIATAMLPEGMARQGMVRASFGPWNTTEDIEILLRSLDQIQATGIAGLGYTPRLDGSWVPTRPRVERCFSLDELAERSV
jgi:cysteine desulfurase/selenocysteine lyase